MYVMPKCPYCNSRETGEIRTTEAFSVKEELNIKRLNAKKGIRIYYTDRDEYRILCDAGANYYCFSCRHPFHGKRSRISMNDEQKSLYMEASGIAGELKVSQIKRPGLIKRFIAILRGY